MSASEIVREFVSILDSVTAVFLDSRDGFELLQIQLEAENQDRNWNEPVYFGDGPPSQVRNVAHTTTIGDRIGRNACDGANCTFVSNMAVVAIYSYWEDYYRLEIAKAMNLTNQELKSDIFGEIRRLRQAIVHHHGKATAEVAAAKLLAWFDEGEEIFFSQAMFFRLVSEIREYLKTIPGIAL